MSLEKKLRTLSRLLKRYLYVQTHTLRHPHTHTHTQTLSHSCISFSMPFPFWCWRWPSLLLFLAFGTFESDSQWRQQAGHFLVCRTSGQRDIGSNGRTRHCDAFEFYQRHVEIFKLSTFVLELGKANPNPNPTRLHPPRTCATLNVFHMYCMPYSYQI